MDRFSCIDANAVPVRCGEERAKKRKSKAFNLPVDLSPYPHLLSWALGSDQKNEIVDTNYDNFSKGWLASSLEIGSGWVG